MIAEWHDPYIFVLCIVVYIIIHVAYHYMGQHGISWEMRKNNKKVKNKPYTVVIKFCCLSAFFCESPQRIIANHPPTTLAPLCQVLSLAPNPLFSLHKLI